MQGQNQMVKRGERIAHVAEIACPVLRALFAEAELNLNLKLLRAQDLLCALLVHILRLSIDQHGEGGRAI